MLYTAVHHRYVTEPTVVVRLGDKFVFDPGGCWLWQGYRSPKGYGQIFSDGRLEGVHRAAYKLYVSPIGEGLFVLHKCDNPPCFNPEHLFLGTPLDNMLDAKRKGRLKQGWQKSAYGERSNTAKLTAAQSIEIRKLIGTGLTYAQIGARYGVQSNAIFAIASGKTWKCTL